MHTANKRPIPAIPDSVLWLAIQIASLRDADFRERLLRCCPQSRHAQLAANTTLEEAVAAHNLLTYSAHLQPGRLCRLIEKGHDDA